MKREFRFLVDGQPVDQETMRRWLQANGYDTNYSQDKDIAARASETIRNWVDTSQSYKKGMKERWDVIDYMMRGQSLADMSYMVDGGTHVPEVRKRIDVLAPRIVRALGGASGEVFECVARRPDEDMRAAVNEEWLRYQLDQSGYLKAAEDRVRCGLTYGVIAVSTGWKTEFRTQQVRKSRRSLSRSKQQVLVIEDELKEILVYEGFDWRMIDPRNLIWDGRSTDPRNPLFAGEYMETTIPELLAMEANGIVSGVVDAIEGKSPSRSKGLLRGVVEELRNDTLGDAARDGDRANTLRRWAQKVTALTADRVPCLSVFGKWSDKAKPYKSSDWGSWQFLYVNNVPVRIARSPYDAQHIPIATCRICADPLRFWGISPAMAALNQSIEYDQHRAAMSRLALLKANPILAAKPGSNLPESIAALLPGQVVEGEFSPIGIPGSLSDSAAISEIMRRDIMESMGAPEGFTGNAEEGTATQYMGNIAEADSRIRQHVLNIAEMDLTVIQHAALVSKQYVTENKSFRVLGRHAPLLGAGAEIKPEDLMDPVDIVMIGPRDFASHSTRASRLTTWFTTMAPVLTNLAQTGEIDQRALAEESYMGIVGQRLSDKVFIKKQDADTALSPMQERKILNQGRELHPHPLDDPQAHLDQHMIDAQKAEEEGADDDVLTVWHDHIIETMAQIAQQGAQQQAQQRQLAMQAQMDPQTIEATDGRNAPGEGRTYQRPPDFGTGPADQPPGQSPGPADPARMAQPDRAATIPQTVP